VGAAPAWIEPYVGLPYRTFGRERDGIDCWGLFRLVARDRRQLMLPEYAGGYQGTGQQDAADLKRLIEGGQSDWREIARRGAEDPLTWFKAMERAAEEADALLISFWGHPVHVAYYVQPGLALHVLDGAMTTQLRYRDAEWRNKVVGIYRHRSLI
jgi:cell wall-associated NlpC family hydrolase